VIYLKKPDVKILKRLERVRWKIKKNPASYGNELLEK